MNILKKESEKLGINLSDAQIRKFKVYMEYLLEYNSHTNLTAIKNPEDIVIKHFIDSIILDKFLDMKSSCKVIDIGTGAGFPGIPLKILRENIDLTLVDSLNKRIVFLKELLIKLNLKAGVFHGRAEDMGKDHKFREKFDIAASRAVAPLNVLCEYCLPYVKINGYFAALKGSDVKEEIQKSGNALQVLGGKIQARKEFELPGNKGWRSIIIIKKINETPLKYPRSNSQISKKAL